MLKNKIGLTETDTWIELSDIWDYTLKVSDWVYDILLNWSEEKKKEQINKLWTWLNRWNK